MMRFRTFVIYLIISTCVTWFVTTFTLYEFRLKPYRAEIELYKMKVAFLEHEIRNLKTTTRSLLSPTIQAPEISESAQKTQALASIQQTQNTDAIAERKAAEMKAAVEKKVQEKRRLAIEQKTSKTQTAAKRKKETEKAAAGVKSISMKKTEEKKLMSESVKPILHIKNKQAILAKGCADIGRDKINNGDYRGAIELYSEVIAIYPGDSLCYRWLGDAYYNLGDKKQAIKEWKEAARLGDRIIQSYLNNMHVE